MIQGVILDVDGTLVLSNDAHARAWVDAFAEYGYAVPFERVRPLIGMGGDKLLPTVVPGLSDQEGEGKEIARRRQEIFLARYASSLAPTPGAHAFVQYVVDRGLKAIVASSAKPDELETLLTAAGVESLLPERTTTSDADESKPAPDVVSVALDRLGLPQAEAVMIGDTPYDVASARGAGIGVIALRCGGFSDQDLAAATAIYDDPADLLARWRIR